MNVLYLCLCDGVLVLPLLAGWSDWRHSAHIDDGAAPEIFVLQQALDVGDAVVRILQVWIRLLATVQRTLHTCNIRWIQLSGHDVAHCTESERGTTCMCNIVWIQFLSNDAPHVAEHSMLHTSRLIVHPCHCQSHPRVCPRASASKCFLYATNRSCAPSEWPSRGVGRG